MRSLEIRLAAVMVMVGFSAAAEAQTAPPDLSASYMNANAAPAAWAPPLGPQSGVVTITRIPDVPRREVALQVAGGGLNAFARTGSATYIRNLGESMALEAALAVGAGNQLVGDIRSGRADWFPYGTILGQFRINDPMRPSTFWTIGAIRELGVKSEVAATTPSSIVLGWGLRTPSPTTCCGFRLDLQALFAGRTPAVGGRIAFGVTLRLD